MTAKQFINQGFHQVVYEYDRETMDISTKPVRLIVERFENGKWVEWVCELGKDGLYHRINTDDIPTVDARP